jgi:conjugal transfer pilus assembly protein TraW
MLFPRHQNQRNNFFKYFLLIFIFSSPPTFSQDLGIFGKTYLIIEQDFFEYIKERLKKLEVNGQLATMQAKLAEETRKHVDSPKPVANITKATQNRSWVFDPTITVKSDIKEPNGKVVVKAGMQVNPLNIISITKTLVFYDADDQAQVAWAQKIDKKLEGKTKLVLVNGSIFSQVKLFQKAIYFDQSGKLTAHFGIQHVPATISQTEVTDELGSKLKRLKVAEIQL